MIINKKVINKLQKLFPIDGVKIIRVKMLYTKEINRFIHKVERAHKLTAKSKLIFKNCLE